jgi:serine/threonine protein kinase/tetratricopeptide (TPR) repeat protein
MSHLDDETAAEPVVKKRESELGRGTCVGRYVLLDPLGQGGMGVVYKAYDPELDRPIALKLLRAADGDAPHLRERLLREAQALARLTHPNVIAVHDVGTYRGHVFIAMELVEGKTLRAWLRERPRSRREILDAFLAAGEGLAAAHRAGLVHRDFKPDNVMLAEDGRVRVLDFGLARTAHGGPEGDSAASADLPASDLESTVESRGSAKTPPPPEAPKAPPVPAFVSLGSASGAHTSSSTHNSSNLLATPLTHVGAIVGTPRFMAPEQHTSDATDERADQFSFCVSLYWALYGAFPFDGDTHEDLLDNVLMGRLADPPAGATVPRWVRQVLVKGLAVKPTDRYASMPALLEALRADPSVTRRLWLRAGAAVVVVAAVAVGWRATQKRQVRVCAGAQTKLVGVWDDARRAAARTAFHQSGKPYAEAALATVERALDAYAGGWVAMRTDACEATHVRGEQSQELLDLRMSCLDGRLIELKTLTDLYASADGAVVEHAAQSAQSLPALAPCADAQALRAPIAAPRDPQTLKRVEGVREQLARADALELAAKYDEGLRVTRAALAETSALKYPPVEAEAQLLLGRLLGAHGDWVESANALHRALVAALAGHHDEVAAKSATTLIQAVGSRQAHYADGLGWAELAEALAGRLQRRDEILSVIYSNRSEVRERESKYDEALADAKRALELELRALGPDHPIVAGTYHQLGNIYFQTAQYPEAVDSFQRSLAIRQRTVGQDHPLLVKPLVGLANVYGDSGDHDRAFAMYQRALAVLKRVNPDDPDIAQITNNLGDEFLWQGRPREAFEHYQAALVDFQKRVGPSLDTTLALNNMGDAKLAMNQPDEALKLYRRGLETCVPVLGGDHQLCGQLQWGIGESNRRLGRLDEAATSFQRSLAVGEKALGPTHPRVAEPLLGLGRVALARHNPAAAKAPLERALAIREAQPGDGIQLADVRFALAQALWLGDRSRSRELAKQARDVYAKAAGASAHRSLEEANAWLTGH